MLEKEVVLRCRQTDLELVEQLLPSCLDELQKVWGEKTRVIIDKDNYLPPDSAGGVEVLTQGGKIRVSSTLESRLDLIANQVSVFLWYTVFSMCMPSWLNLWKIEEMFDQEYMTSFIDDPKGYLLYI